MRRSTSMLIAGMLICSSAAFGKLPPPTAEEQAAAAAKKSTEQAQLEKEKALLEKAQDRTVARYKSENPGARRTGAAERTSGHNLPKTAKEPPRGVGPKPDMPQSAEAHSGNAK